MTGQLPDEPPAWVDAIDGTPVRGHFPMSILHDDGEHVAIRYGDGVRVLSWAMIRASTFFVGRR